MRTIVFCAALVLAPLLGHAQDPNAGRNLAASCAMCHGTDGRATGAFEPLAGMRADDMVRKLKEFRDDKRPATVMHQIAKGYTERQMELIAAYFAAQKR
jgi:cytochrome c553